MRKVRFLVLAIIIASTRPVSAGDISGPVWVIDGDTFKIEGETIRLQGIDAPERDACLRASEVVRSFVVLVGTI